MDWKFQPQDPSRKKEKRPLVTAQFSRCMSRSQGNWFNVVKRHRNLKTIRWFQEGNMTYLIKLNEIGAENTVDID